MWQGLSQDLDHTKHALLLDGDTGQSAFPPMTISYANNMQILSVFAFVSSRCFTDLILFTNIL